MILSFMFSTLNIYWVFSLGQWGSFSIHSANVFFYSLATSMQIRSPSLLKIYHTKSLHQLLCCKGAFLLFTHYINFFLLCIQHVFRYIFCVWLKVTLDKKSTLHFKTGNNQFDLFHWLKGIYLWSKNVKFTLYYVPP